MESHPFGRSVRAVRTARNMTQAQFAEQSGISRLALAAIESGAYLPNVAVAVRLARLAGESVAELFGDLEESYEHRIRARWKRSPAATANKRPVVLARVHGKMVALAMPKTRLALAASSGLRLKRRGDSAHVATSLLDDEIEGTLLVAGCDPSVSILIAWMARTGSRINAVALPCSSGRALAALAAQSVHVAGLHMRDPRTGDYNRPQVRAVRAGRIRLINFSRWEVGLARARENPRGIRDFQDLANSNVRFINRGRGAGARQAPDEALAEADINPIRVNGYRQEAGGHLEVAAAIAQGIADAGVTIRVAAQAYGPDFIPLREERSDLAIPEAEFDSTPVKRMLDALDSRRFAKRCPSSAATTPR